MERQKIRQLHCHGLKRRCMAGFAEVWSVLAGEACADGRLAKAPIHLSEWVARSLVAMDPRAEFEHYQQVLQPVADACLAESFCPQNPVERSPRNQPRRPVDATYLKVGDKLDSTISAPAR